MTTKRLRVFAGPNGSGKSTLVRHISGKLDIHFGYFVNADVIEKSLRETGQFDASDVGIQFSKAEFLAVAQTSSLREKLDFSGWFDSLKIENRQFISLPNVEITSYHAALIAEFLRQKLLAEGQSFTFETVLSDARKLDFLTEARRLGYRIYLYFVATEHPGINLARVKSRAGAGGHDVPSEKVFSRYDRSLALLPKVVALTNRAFIFDNSVGMKWAVEITDGKDLELKNGTTPGWVKKALSV